MGKIFSYLSSSLPVRKGFDEPRTNKTDRDFSNRSSVDRAARDQVSAQRVLSCGVAWISLCHNSLLGLLSAPHTTYVHTHFDTGHRQLQSSQARVLYLEILLLYQPMYMFAWRCHVQMRDSGVISKVRVLTTLVLACYVSCSPYRTAGFMRFPPRSDFSKGPQR